MKNQHIIYRNTLIELERRILEDFNRKKRQGIVATHAELLAINYAVGTLAQRPYPQKV